MDRKDHAKASDAIWWAAVILVLVMTAIAGSADHDEAQRQADECQEMRELWEETDGEQGWPHC